MEAIDIATANVAAFAWDESALARWPRWLRAVILFGGGAGVWAVIGWVTLLLLNMN